MSSLSNAARSAVVWNVGFNLFRDVLQFATMLALVRLLPPASYGEFALVSSITTFIAFVTFPNFIAYALQVKSEADVHFQDHFTAGLYIQGFAFILVNGLAAVLRFYPSYEGIAPYIHVMSINLILSLPYDLRRTMLVRQYKWKRFTVLNASGIFAGSAVGLALALNGGGTYSLLVPGLLMQLPVIYDLFFVAKWRPKLTWEWRNYRPAFSFGLTRIGSGVVVGGRSIVETASLSVILGFSGLGIYNRAIGLAQMFCARFSSLLLEAIYPVLTRVSDEPGNTRRVGDLVIRLVAWVSVPIAVTLGTLAPQVVRVIYGNQWSMVATILPWALAASVSASLIGAGNSLLLSRHKPKLCLAIDICLLCGVVFALLISREGSALLYLMGINAMQVTLLIAVGYLLYQQGALSPRGVFDAVIAPALASSLAWLCATLFTPAAISDTAIIIHIIFQSALWGAVFVISYIVVLRFIFSEPLKRLVEHFPMRDMLFRILAFK